MDSKIKITFFAASLYFGGNEKCLIDILKSLNREKFQISLVLCERRGEFLDSVPKDINIFSFDRSHIRSVVFKLGEYFRKEKPDIFISSLTHVNIVTLIAKMLFRAKSKIVVMEQTTLSLTPVTAKNIMEKFLLKFIFPVLIKFFYPKADYIICGSLGMKRDLVSIIGNFTKIKVIYNLLDVNDIITKSLEKLEEQWLKKDKNIVIAVGRLVKAKDYSTLIKAFKLVLHKIPFALLIILGYGPEEKNLKNLVSLLEMQSSVKFLGFKENPYKYIANSSVFVLSSIREGFGNVIVEAMACGTPVVATDCRSGPGEIIESGINGLIVPQGDINMLSCEIIRVLKDRDLAQKLSIMGKKRAQDFSINSRIKDYESFLTDIVINNKTQD